MRNSMILLAIMLSFTRTAEAQEPVGGFLFAYEPHRGRRAAFEEGYRRHLEWHRAHADSLVWHGWDVLAGPRLGMFVDGVFGIRFAALDARVDPAGDAADAALNVTAHAEPTGREVVQLRRELSTATPLEDGAAPRSLVQVVRYRVRPGATSHFLRALERLRELAHRDSLLPLTVYEILAGESPGFLLMIWRDGFASFDATDSNPEPALRRLLAELEAGPGWSATELDAGITNELWRYRPDLTYLGPEVRRNP